MTYFQTKSKYHNVRQSYDGYIYASKKEASRAVELNLLLKAKEIIRWEKQITLPLCHLGTKVCDYRIDFIRYETTGDIVLEEVKGFWTDAARLKRNMLEAILEHPKSEDYKIIAQKVGTKKNLILYEVIK